MTVSQMLEEMDSKEFSEWQAFLTIQNEIQKETLEKKQEAQVQASVKGGMTGYNKNVMKVR